MASRGHGSGDDGSDDAPGFRASASLKSALTLLKRGFDPLSGPIHRSLSIALREIGRHPWRTLLAAQGMLWAVALTTLPAAVLEGSRRQAIEQAAELQTDLVQVSPGNSLEMTPQQYPSESDLEAVDRVIAAEAKARSDRRLPPPALTAFRVRSGLLAADSLAGAAEGSNPSTSAWLLGTDDDAFELLRVEILAGRAPELEPATAVGRVLEGGIEEALARRLLGIAAPDPTDLDAPPAPVPPEQLAPLLGRVVEITWPPRQAPATAIELRFVESPPARIPLGVDRSWVRIVGVIEDQTNRTIDDYGFRKRKRALSFAEPLLRLVGLTNNPSPWKKDGTAIFLPRAAVPGARLDWIMARVHPNRVVAVKKELETIFVERGREVLLYSNLLLPILTHSEIGTYFRIHDYLFWLFLIVGIAVLTNILLLAGFRRRREIALRRAEGATRWDVFTQFLCEGWLVAVVGLVLGVVVGMLLAHLRVWLDENVLMAAIVPWREIGRAGLILTAAALLASAYPAWWVTRFHPMSLFRRM